MNVVRFASAPPLAAPPSVSGEVGAVWSLQPAPASAVSRRRQATRELKAQSPFKPTAVFSLANGYNGYLPTPEHHRLGGYETWRAKSSYLEVDAAPKITSKLLELLKSVK